MTTRPTASEVASVRAFNRLYTHRLGLLNKHLDDSPFSLTEARILYEVAHRHNPTAAVIGRALGVDRAQLSRVLRNFTRGGLIQSTPSPEHARRQLLSLTQEGRRSFAALDRNTQQAISTLLGEFSDDERQRFVSAASAIRAMLGENIENTLDRNTPAQRPFGLRPPRAGDLGWIVHRQAVVYAEEYGWDWTYEALVARILAEYVERFDPAYEQAWLAETVSGIVGSVFLMRGDEPGVARLRLLYVERHARGMGVGRALVATCIERARAAGYERLDLWTNDILVSARRLYEAAGFRLAREEPHHSFGQDLIGQTWSLNLSVE